MIRVLLFTFVLLLSIKTWAQPAKLNTFNYILGTQAIGQRYHFTNDTPLVESAKLIRQLGSNIFKFTMSREGSFDPVKGNVPERDASIQSLLDLATREPSHKAVLDMPFAYYFIWTYPLGCKTTAGLFKDNEREYQEMYELSCHLLKTYNGTGKHFYLGHWEGDWHLRPHFDPKQGFSEGYRDHFIAWLRIRQKAVDDAKRDTPHQNVELFHYTEVNLVEPYLKGGECLTNDILPQVDVDYVSYSCYDSLQRVIHDDLFASLNHIESKLKPKPSIAGKRVFIGEYGFPTRRYTAEEQEQKTRETLIAALEWGCPFALYWELYCNEEHDGKRGGFWLIDDKNVKQPVWYTHQTFYEQANLFLVNYQQKHGTFPPDDEYRKTAVKILIAIGAQKR